jgi:hypothetical protein
MNKSDSHQNTQQVGGSTFAPGPGASFYPQQFGEAASYGSAQLSSDFVPGNSSEVMNFPGFQNPYMSMPYGYMPYSYDYGNYNQRKSYTPYKKKYNYSYTTTQRIYTKKPKQVVKVNGEQDGSDKTENTAKENGMPDIEKLPHHIDKAKFFVIKSYSEADVHKAIKHNVWCSTKEGNVKLHDIYVAADNEYPIFLLFSVNSSGHFVGVAQMKSHVDFDKNFEGWNQSHKWKGVFKISWIYIKDIPNKELRHLKNEFNEGKPVPNSRDCQEVPFEVGVKVLEMFENFKNQTSILDDYEFYEMNERAQV